MPDSTAAAILREMASQGVEVDVEETLDGVTLRVGDEEVTAPTLYQAAVGLAEALGWDLE